MDNIPNIYAVTISKNYSDVLSIGLKENLNYFKKWFIVTQEDDTETINLIEDLNDSRIELIYYPLDHRCVKDDHAKSLLTSEEDLELTTPDYLEPFPQGRKRSKRQQQDYETLTKNGVVFDKGGATRQIQKFVLPQHNVSEDDLILLLDSDIVLPKNFLETIQNTIFRENRMYTCFRKNYTFHSDYLADNARIDKNTMIGAGYFHLYKYDPSKLAKRTYTAGWSDWYFKNLFKELSIIKNLIVSHLGEPDINWFGKKCETYLHDDQISNYCEQENIMISSDNEKNKLSILNSIRVKRLKNLERKRGAPNFYFVGTINSDLDYITSLFSNHNDVSFFQQTHPNLSFFGSHYVNDELWHKNFNWYLECFPKITNHLWCDKIEFDYAKPGTNNAIISRFRTFIERSKNWGEFGIPKIIVVAKKPILRALSQYQYYHDNLPASYNWNWKNADKCFEYNILNDDGTIDEHSSFVKNGKLFKLAEYLLTDLKIKSDRIFYINPDEDVSIIREKIESIMNVKLNENIVPHKLILNDDYCINKNAIELFNQHFEGPNEKFKNYSGINFNE